MLDKTKYLWKFHPFGNPIKDKYHYVEMLWSHHVVSQASLVQSYDAEVVLGYEREAHRRAIAEKIAEAMYKGWMPYDMEWWEGQFDDWQTLRDYNEPRNGDYHFWTKVRLASVTTPILKRNPSPDEVTILSYGPEKLS